MRELTNVEARWVAGAIYQPEPGTGSGIYRNPQYVYWNAADSLQYATTIVIERA